MSNPRHFHVFVAKVRDSENARRSTLLAGRLLTSDTRANGVAKRGCVDRAGHFQIGPAILIPPSLQSAPSCDISTESDKALGERPNSHSPMRESYGGSPWLPPPTPIR